ncbi:MAG: hypothetical protein LBE71_04645 [Dysgonamonadaceae bacterium]|nr:hypothetical protein [Dysgonamonadaceae bacterium]
MNMKTKTLHMIFVVIFTVSSAMAQDNAFEDDIYFSSKNKKPAVIQSEPAKKENTIVLEATVPAGGRSVDEYNRRYVNDTEYIDEALTDETDTIIEYADGELTQRIVRFHDPSKVVISGADNVNIYYADGSYALYFDEPSSDGLSININTSYGYSPWYAGWDPWYYGYGRYSPWHYGYGWYSPWYYGSWYLPYYYGGWYGGYYSGRHHHYGGRHYYYGGISDGKNYHSQYTRNTRSSNSNDLKVRSSGTSSRSLSSARSGSSGRTSSRGDIVSSSSRSERQSAVRSKSSSASSSSSNSRSYSPSSESRSSSSSITPARSSSSSSNSYSDGSSRSSSNSSSSYSGGSSRSSSGGRSDSGGGGGRSSSSGGGRR